MPLDYALLAEKGTHERRLQEIFTADPSKLPEDATEEEKKNAHLDWEMRTRIEELLASRIDEAIIGNLKTSHLHAAVDLAWDSSVITRKTVPLVMYAQNRISMSSALRDLEGVNCLEQYVKRDERGNPKRIEIPKFTDVNVNLVRSIITRRVAAQSARYTNLYPCFKYETRGTSEADKLRGDLMSQRIDIMADQYDYRTAQICWIRDMLLYPFAMVFPSCKWEREVEWYYADDEYSEELKPDGSAARQCKARVKREGVPLISPHSSRVFYDIAHPITSINSDTGCEWFGFWDVVRYSQIANNLDYFNRAEIGYFPESSNWFYSYSSYFSQYYTTISPPVSSDKISEANDRKAQLGRYDSSMHDNSVFLTHFYWKVQPNQWRMGNYPHPVWLHLTVANSRTVVHAEIMPDCPGFVFSFNASSQRLVNLSMAHDLLPWQDQLTNLYTELLECVKRDLFGIAILNLDAFPQADDGAKRSLEEFRRAMRNEDFYSAISCLEVSLIKLRDLGVDLDSVFKMVRQDSPRQISEILQAISQTIQLAERVMALSPQEQAQLSPRETSATEVQVIAGTTENIYQFISDSIDSGRAAIKRYLYNALMSCGSKEFKLPVSRRYRKSVIERARFEIIGEEDVNTAGDDAPRLLTVSGNTTSLVAEYVFNSRDGSDRSSNIQSAQTLVQMLNILLNPAVMAMLTKENLADIINSIIRQSGAGVDVVIEPQPGDGPSPVQPMVPGVSPQVSPPGEPPEIEFTPD